MSCPSSILKYLALGAVLFIWIAALESNCVELTDVNDDEFEAYLKNAMKNYTTWLKANNLDPSPPIQKKVVFNTTDLQKVQLECEVSNQYLRGHSETIRDISIAASSFESHLLAMGRTVHQHLYEIHGIFNCTGALIAENFEELKADLPFSGQGKFLITTNSSTEALMFQDVGITDTVDRKIDLSHSSVIIYAFNPTHKFVELKGEWNDTKITDEVMYLSNVTREFGNAFRTYFMSNKNLENPSSQLLDQYMREIIENVKLVDIIKEGELPEPYEPTTTTITTTTTFTSTTPTTTTPSGVGKGVFINFGIFNITGLLLVYRKILCFEM